MAAVDRLTLIQNAYPCALDDYKARVDEDGDVEFIDPDVGAFFIVLHCDEDPGYFNIIFVKFKKRKTGAL
jgi:hypothetical protein